MRNRRRKEEEEEEEEWWGPSAAASSGLLASLATRQCGVGGGMLGSNLDTVSLQHKRHAEAIYMAGFYKIKLSFPTGHIPF